MRLMRGACVVVTLMAGPAWAGGVELATHHAVYSMDLASTQQGSGIVGAHGTMTYDFADSCDGWISENRIGVIYAYTEGAEADTMTDYVTWESKDGLKFRFRLRSTRDGQVTDEIEGTAHLKGKGLGGVVHYTRPEDKDMALPKGTLFPTEHTKILIAAAQKGEKAVSRVVFDGSDIQGPFDVNAVIGQIRPMPASFGGTPAASTSWPVRLAFYQIHSTEAEPEFEMAVDYHANGVAQSILQAFKGFSLIGQLKTVEPGAKRGC